MKPLIVFVDDEQPNLDVFEFAMPADQWTIRTFQDPAEALDFAMKNNVWVTVSDQRMGKMSGVSLLEIVKRSQPECQRVIVTGFSDEDSVYDSIKKAQIHDYIRKPWDVDDLTHRIGRLVEDYKRNLELKQRTADLEVRNKELVELTQQLTVATKEVKSAQRELESWTHPFIVKSLVQKQFSFPVHSDLALVTFDIVNGCDVHDLQADGRPVRSQILKGFSEIVIRHGGWRESTNGDSAYAHFGLFKNQEGMCNSAYAVASEFRMFLRHFCAKHGLDVECGIGLHLAKSCLVDVLTVEIQSPDGFITQKSFDTTSIDVDLVHRIEKIAHSLPGSTVGGSGPYFTEGPKITDSSFSEVERQG